MTEKVSRKQHIQNEAEYVLKHFNFETVHKVMTLLNWRWCWDSTVPSLEKIKEVARTVVQDVITEYLEKGEQNKCYRVATGGFEAVIWWHCLELRFHAETAMTLLGRPDPIPCAE